MKKVLWIVIMMLSLVFVSCIRDDDRDEFVGSYEGTISMNGTKVVNGGAPQPVSETRTGSFTIAKAGKKGKRVTIKITDFNYGTLGGSVDGSTLTIDPVHLSTIDLVFDPAQMKYDRLTLNGTIHTITTTAFTTEDLQADLLIKADKQQ